MRKLILTLGVIVPILFVASPASATPSPKATGTITASGCNLTDSVAWDHLPPIYRIDTTLAEDGSPTIIGASIINYPQLGQPPLTSPQVIETFAPRSTITPHTFDVVFVLRDRQGRQVASVISNQVTAECSLNE